MTETAARTYEVKTYGCQMNVHDSERLTGLLEDASASMTALEGLVDDAGGRFSEEIAAQFFEAEPGLVDLIRFYTAVSAQCEAPGDFAGG